MAHDGFAVVVNYAGSTKDAEAAVAEVKSAGGEAIGVKADVADPADAERLFAETLKEFDSVDVSFLRKTSIKLLLPERLQSPLIITHIELSK